MKKLNKLTIPVLGAAMVAGAMVAAVALVELVNYAPAMAIIAMIAAFAIAVKSNK